MGRHGFGRQWMGWRRGTSAASYGGQYPVGRVGPVVETRGTERAAVAIPAAPINIDIRVPFEAAQQHRGSEPVRDSGGHGHAPQTSAPFETVSQPNHIVLGVDN